MIENRKIVLRNTISDRKFGISFAVLFAVIALWVWFKPWMPFWIAAGISALFLVLALTSSRTLHPLNQLWFWIGIALQKVTTPVILGVMFFLVLLPISMFRRRARAKFRNEFRRRQERKSYWIQREDGDVDFKHIF